MNSKNIEDVTNSPEDWEDFWHSPEKYGTWDTTSDDIVVNMDGGVGGSWKELTEEEEAASLEITVDELRLQKQKNVPLKKLPHQRLHGH